MKENNAKQESTTSYDFNYEVNEVNLGFIAQLKKRAKKLKTETFALYLAYKDPRTPWYAKLLAAVIVAYALSPIDLIPDFIPVFGYLDDLILLPLGISLALKLIPAEIMNECRLKAQEELNGSKPKGWSAAVVIISIWLGVLLLVYWIIIGI